MRLSSVAIEIDAVGFMVTAQCRGCRFAMVRWDTRNSVITVADMADDIAAVGHVCAAVRTATDPDEIRTPFVRTTTEDGDEAARRAGRRHPSGMTEVDRLAHGER